MFHEPEVLNLPLVAEGFFFPNIKLPAINIYKSNYHMPLPSSDLVLSSGWPVRIAIDFKTNQ